MRNSPNKVLAVAAIRDALQHGLCRHQILWASIAMQLVLHVSDPDFKVVFSLQLPVLWARIAMPLVLYASHPEFKFSIPAQLHVSCSLHTRQGFLQKRLHVKTWSDPAWPLRRPSSRPALRCSSFCAQQCLAQTGAMQRHADFSTYLSMAWKASDPPALHFAAAWSAHTRCRCRSLLPSRNPGRRLARCTCMLPFQHISSIVTKTSVPASPCRWLCGQQEPGSRYHLFWQDPGAQNFPECCRYAYCIDLVSVEPETSVSSLMLVSIRYLLTIDLHDCPVP